MDEMIENINAATLKISDQFKNAVGDMTESAPVILPANGRDDELIEIIAMLKCDISYITRKVCVDGKKETLIVLTDSYDD